MVDDWISTLGSIYFWGFIVALAMQLWGTVSYFFEHRGANSIPKQPQQSWRVVDPILFTSLFMDEFKHTFFRYLLEPSLVSSSVF